MIESSLIGSSNWDSDLFEDNTFKSESRFNILDYSDSNDFQGYNFSSYSEPLDDQSSVNSSDTELLTFEDFLCGSDDLPNEIFNYDSNAIEFPEPSLSPITSCPNKHTASADSNLNHVSNTTSTAKWKKKISEYLCSPKSWSKMSPEEQIQTLHTLSEIVTSHMGIREQMEVIKIIDPTAIISPDDKEFALDSSFLNNSKMKRIKDIVRKNVHFVSNSSNSKPTSRSPSIASSKKSYSTNSRFHPAKRRQRKPKIPPINEQQRKVLIQKKKEKQSGLFLNERVIVGTRGSEENENKPKIPSITEQQRKTLIQNKKERQSGFFLNERIIVGTRGSEENEDVNILE